MVALETSESGLMKGVPYQVFVQICCNICEDGKICKHPIMINRDGNIVDDFTCKKLDAEAVMYHNYMPDYYKCSKCGTHGVRLYRDYQSCNIDLTCTKCTIDNQGNEKFDVNRPHNIGWKVAAVPDPNDGSYWGYTSMPEAGVRWWNRLVV